MTQSDTTEFKVSLNKFNYGTWNNNFQGNFNLRKLIPYSVTLALESH